MFAQNIMANITLKISDDLHRRLKARKEIRWSEVLRQLLDSSLDRFERVDNILQRNNLTEKDVEEISKKIDSGVAKKLNL